jgi:hypothetical protein
MTPRAASIMMFILVPLAIVACNRSEELGQLPEGGAGSGGGGGSSGSAGSGGEGGSAKNDAGSAGSCGKVSCLLPDGEACGAGSACSSGLCVSGVCCNTACAGTCMACDVAGSVGTCTQEPSCLLPNGEACGAGSGCSSGFCVSGVCCNTACAGTCTACDVAGSVGTCSQEPSCS